MLDKLGERIARHRTRLGWTQQELADRIAASRTAISHFEMDLAMPSERTIVLLAGLFKCEPPELVANTYYPPTKADRLPPVAARYTEVEKELCLFEHDVSSLLDIGPAKGVPQLLVHRWLDRLLALHSSASDERERHMIEVALHTLRRMREWRACEEE